MYPAQAPNCLGQSCEACQSSHRNRQLIKDANCLRSHYQIHTLFTICARFVRCIAEIIANLSKLGSAECPRLAWDNRAGHSGGPRRVSDPRATLAFLSTSCRQKAASEGGSDHSCDWRTLTALGRIPTFRFPALRRVLLSMPLRGFRLLQPCHPETPIGPPSTCLQVFAPTARGHQGRSARRRKRERRSRPIIRVDRDVSMGQVAGPDCGVPVTKS